MCFGYSSYDAWKTSPPEPPEPEEDEYDNVANQCDKCGDLIHFGETCYVFVDNGDKRVFCTGCLIEFEFEEE